MQYLIWYLWFGLGFGTFVYLWMCLGDIIDGPDQKFGYTYNSGFTAIMVCACIIPIVNIVGIPFMAQVIVGHTYDKFQRSRMRKQRHAESI